MRRWLPITAWLLLCLSPALSAGPPLPRQDYTGFPTRAFYPDLLNSLTHYCDSSSPANIYTCPMDNGGLYTLAPTSGQLFVLTVSNANTGPSTLAITGDVARPVKKWSGPTLTDLATGDLVAGKQTGLRFDGTNYQVDGGGPSAPTTSQYLLRVADGLLPNAQAMGALGSGLVFNTTTTGVQSIYTTSGTGTTVCLVNSCVLEGTTTASRLLFAGAPAFDIGYGVLGVSVILPLDTADHTLAANKAFDHIRVSQTTGANNTFTVGANTVVTGYRALLTLNSGSDSTAAMYGGAFGITNAGPGSAKSVHGAVAGSGASTGVLVAFNAQIQPVATTNAFSAAVQVSLTSSSGAHDVVSGMNIGSSGDRFLYGIGSPGGPVPYGQAAFMAWMATGSSGGADFLRLLNNAGATIFNVTKDGGITATTLKSATGERYLCIDTTGQLISRATACNAGT